MKNINSLFFSLFSSSLFFGIVLLSFINSTTTFFTFILFLLVFLPLLLPSFVQGLRYYIFVVAGLIGISIISIETVALVSLLFVAPAIILSFITLRYKEISLGIIISTITLYTLIIITSASTYYLLTIENISIYNTLYDTVTFVSIMSNQYIKDILQPINDIDQYLRFFAFFIPSFLSLFYIPWVFFNYKLSLKISGQTDLLKHKIINFDNFQLPSIYTYIFVIFILLTLISHNLLDNSENLYYILYNVVFILCLSYFYVGFHFIWNKVKQKDSLFINLLFVVLFVILLVELIVVFSILGIVLEMKKISVKKS